MKELFNLVSKRFPNPDELHVAIYTSLDQIPTPEEEDVKELFHLNPNFVQILAVFVRIASRSICGWEGTSHLHMRLTESRRPLSSRGLRAQLKRKGINELQLKRPEKPRNLFAARPGATHTEEVVLDQPFKDTKPPWGEWQDTKRI